MSPTSLQPGPSVLAPRPIDSATAPNTSAERRLDSHDLQTRSDGFRARACSGWRALAGLLLLGLAAASGSTQTNGSPWRLLTFSDGGRSRAEVIVVDHADPEGNWMESRAWMLDPNGRRLAIAFTATIDGGSISTSVRISDVVSRREFEVGRELRGLTADGGAFDEITDLLEEHTLTRLRVILRTDGDEQDFTAPIQVINQANENEAHRPVFTLLDGSALRQLSLSEPLRGSLIFLQDTACGRMPTTLAVFCNEVVPALLRGRSQGTTKWTLVEDASLSGENPKIQRVLRTFPRRDRRTQYNLRGR